MTDRQPTPGKEGRVLITPEDGSPAFYATLEMADDPLETGTPWAKSTVLQDDTCGILNIPTTSVPDDAFRNIPKLVSRGKESSFQKLLTGRLL